MIHITAIVIFGNGSEERREVSITINAKQLETLRHDLRELNKGKMVFFTYKHI